jgi:hypothetical protein
VLTQQRLGNLSWFIGCARDPEATAQQFTRTQQDHSLGPKNYKYPHLRTYLRDCPRCCRQVPRRDEDMRLSLMSLQHPPMNIHRRRSSQGNSQSDISPRWRALRYDRSDRFRTLSTTSSWRWLVFKCCVAVAFSWSTSLSPAEEAPERMFFLLMPESWVALPPAGT